jgi:acetone carboxylase gamma subunit
MSHPLRENLETVSENGADWIRCSKCQHRYCGADQDWRPFSTVRISVPTQAGALFADLEGGYLLRQLFCPSCAALVETDFIEAVQAKS